MKALALTLLFLASPALAQTPGQAADDWALLVRYRDDNPALLKSGQAPTVVFMGDSITQGWAKEPDFMSDATRVGRGISGQTTPQMLVRFRADVIALKPQVVHIMAGTNDIAGNTGPETDAEIEGYISSMAELAAAHGIRGILASIPPAAGFPWRPGPDPRPRIATINAWLRNYAAEKHFSYVDYGPVLATETGAMKPEFSKDGVHPNAAGFAAMAPAAAAAIRRALP